MAATITVSEVKDNFPTTVVDTEIDMLIDFVNTADTCLDENSVPDNTAQILKLNAVRHMLTLQVNAGRGTVKSETAPSRAARTFNSWVGEDLRATTYGSLLKQIDEFGCVSGLLLNSSRFDMFDIGEDRAVDEFNC